MLGAFFPARLYFPHAEPHRAAKQKGEESRLLACSQVLSHLVVSGIKPLSRLAAASGMLISITPGPIGVQAEKGTCSTPSTSHRCATAAPGDEFPVAAPEKPGARVVLLLQVPIPTWLPGSIVERNQIGRHRGGGHSPDVGGAN
jgi:hypothetical protein